MVGLGRMHSWSMHLRQYVVPVPGCLHYFPALLKFEQDSMQPFRRLRRGGGHRLHQARRRRHRQLHHTQHLTSHDNWNEIAT